MVRWAFTRELAPSACMTMSAVRVAPQDKVLLFMFISKYFIIKIKTYIFVYR